jgi:hypothetical protein
LNSISIHECCSILPSSNIQNVRNAACNRSEQDCCKVDQCMQP